MDTKGPLCQIQLGVVLKSDHDPLGPEQDAGGAVDGDIQGAVVAVRKRPPGCSFPLSSPAQVVPDNLGPHKRFLSEDMISGVNISPEYMSQPWTEEAEGYLAVSPSHHGDGTSQNIQPQHKRSSPQLKTLWAPLRIASAHWKGLRLCQEHSPPWWKHTGQLSR